MISNHSFSLRYYTCQRLLFFFALVFTGSISIAPSVLSLYASGTSRPVSVKARRTASTLRPTTSTLFSFVNFFDALMLSYEP